MGALDGASTDIQGRTQPLVDGERLGSDGGANDIDHGIDGADLVKVDLVD